MNCPQCEEKLEIQRRCRQVRLRCTRCAREYLIHEVAHLLDHETEDLLGRYTSIIYD